MQAGRYECAEMAARTTFSPSIGRSSGFQMKIQTGKRKTGCLRVHSNCYTGWSMYRAQHIWCHFGLKGWSEPVFRPAWVMPLLVMGNLAWFLWWQWTERAVTVQKNMKTSIPVLHFGQDKSSLWCEEVTYCFFFFFFSYLEKKSLVHVNITTPSFETAADFKYNFKASGVVGGKKKLKCFIYWQCCCTVCWILLWLNRVWCQQLFIIFCIFSTLRSQTLTPQSSVLPKLWCQLC